MTTGSLMVAIIDLVNHFFVFLRVAEGGDGGGGGGGGGGSSLTDVIVLCP